MKKPLQDAAAGELKMLKHDIRNQLSNIQMALDQLRYEIPPNASADHIFYMDIIAGSCEKIKEFLEERA